MKRLFLLTICAAVFLCSQFLLNCSSPLESASGTPPNPQPPPPETILVHDTVLICDSNCDSIGDTVYVTDTIFDTFFVIDTLIPPCPDPCPDTCDAPPFCVRLDEHHEKVRFKLHNQSGLHHLEFTANFGERCFDRILLIRVDGEKFEWDPVAYPVFTLNADLRENAKIRIRCKCDKSGHGNDCNDDDDHDDADHGDDDDHDHDDDGDDDHDDDDCCNVEVCLKVTKL